MMWLWAWFTGGGWILVAGGLVVLGLVAAAVVVGATARKRAYARDHARHAWYEPEPMPNPMTSDQDFYGSMTRDEEYGWVAGGPVPLPRIPYWPAPGWREQTAADLSPEALARCDEGCDCEPCLAGYCSQCVLNSGPGVVPYPPPGPDPSWDDAARWDVAALDGGPDLDRLDWLGAQLDGHAVWARGMRAQVTGWLDAAAVAA